MIWITLVQCHVHYTHNNIIIIVNAEKMKDFVCLAIVHSLHTTSNYGFKTGSWHDLIWTSTYQANKPHPQWIILSWARTCSTQYTACKGCTAGCACTLMNAVKLQMIRGYSAACPHVLASNTVGCTHARTRVAHGQCLPFRWSVLYIMRDRYISVWWPLPTAECHVSAQSLYFLWLLHGQNSRKTTKQGIILWHKYLAC